MGNYLSPFSSVSLSLPVSVHCVHTIKAVTFGVNLLEAVMNAVQWHLLHTLGMSRHRTRPLRAERKSRKLFSICDYPGQPSCLHVRLAGRDSLRQTRAVIHRSHHYYHYQNPVVIMGRHPADKPSVLQVEIDGALGPLWALHNVFKGPNAVRVERWKEINSDGENERVRARQTQKNEVHLQTRHPVFNLPFIDLL